MALFLAGCTVGAVAAGASAGQRKFSQNVRSTFFKLAGNSCGSDVLVRSVHIAGHETQEGVTLFRLRATGRSSDGTPQQWEVLRRYEDFAGLRRRLAVRRRRAGGAFPGKTWLLPCSGGRLAERRRLLQGWLQGVLAEFQTGGDARHAFISRQRGQKLQVLHEFLGLSRNGQLQRSARLTPEVAEPAPWTWDVQPLASQALYFGSPAPSAEEEQRPREEEEQRPREEGQASQALYFGSPALHVRPGAPKAEAQALHQQRAREESLARGWQARACPAVVAL